MSQAATLGEFLAFNRRSSAERACDRCPSTTGPPMLTAWGVQHDAAPGLGNPSGSRVLVRVAFAAAAKPQPARVASV